MHIYCRCLELIAVSITVYTVYTYAYLFHLLVGHYIMWAEYTGENLEATKGDYHCRNAFCVDSLLSSALLSKG